MIIDLMPSDLCYDSGIEERLQKIIENGVESIIFDFSHLNVLDSTQIGFLISIQSFLCMNHIELYAKSIPSSISSVYRQTRLNHLFPEFQEEL